MNLLHIQTIRHRRSGAIDVALPIAIGLGVLGSGSGFSALGQTTVAPEVRPSVASSLPSTNHIPVYVYQQDRWVLTFVPATPATRHLVPPPPKPVAAPTPVAAVDDFPPLKLQAIFFNAINPSAIVNGRTVRINDETEGVRVAGITRTNVVFEWRGQRRVWPLSY